ncbi:unnamed protein product [Prunus armeniaca]|uniref:AAA+ ATPase domain-containing protein n=1 Tax=Prunus armeniaca TaxID=36596 RepID=A0A6J5X8F5_PRUAR|nr:unnamed protein product [Prunus armeniaca]
MEIEGASGGHIGGGGGSGRGAYLVWEDLSAVLPNFSKGSPTRRLLNGLSGYAEPGRIMAIMGPSGSGKSTLLDTLAGRLSRNVVMTGNILFNGKKKRLAYGAVEQLWKWASWNAPIDQSELALESGLDSASAFFVTQTLRSIARDGRTVVSSVHQPSSEVFALFDDLFLLSGGETVYFGEAKTAIEFFAEAGVPCPSRRNPSDHFLRCINSDFDIVTATLKGSQRIRDVPTSSDPLMNLATAEIKARLVEKYKRSKYADKRELGCKQY